MEKTPFHEGGKTILTELPPMKVWPFPLWISEYNFDNILLYVLHKKLS